MKRFATCLLIALLIIISLPGLVFAAFDYSGGLLDGRKPAGGLVGNDLRLTDNNETTCVLMNASGFNYEYWMLPTAANIRSYRIKANGGPWRLALATGQNGNTPLFETNNAITDGQLVNVRANNVTYIYVSNLSGVQNNLCEVNVYTTAVPLPVPTGLTGTPGNGHADLSWNPVTDAAGYHVYMDGVKITTSPVTSTTYRASMSNNVDHKFEVSAVDSDGNETARSAAITLKYDSNPPATPTGLTGTAYDGYVDLSWNAVTSSNLNGYFVYVDGVKVTSQPIKTITYRASVTNNVTHNFQVSAISVNGYESGKSNTVITYYDTIPPGKPTGLQGNPSNTSVFLSWNANPGPDGVVGYNVYLDGVKVNSSAVATTSYNVTGLTLGLQYRFTVTALDQSMNESVTSDPITVITIDTIPPGKPSNLKAISGDQSINLSWDLNTEADISGYKIYNGGSFLMSLPKDQHTFNVTGLANGTAYTFSVVAYDLSGNVSPAATITAIPADTIPPAAPQNLTAAAGNKAVSLFWTANTEPDLKGYIIYQDGAKLNIPASKNVYQYISGLTNGKEYSYQVSAVDYAGNESPRSAAVKVTPDISADKTPPKTPTGLAATGNKLSIDATWDKNTEPDLLGYFVYLDGARVTYSPISTNAYNIPNLEKGRTYSVQVSAIDDSGNESPRSAPVMVTVMLVPMPTDFKAKQRGTNSIDLTWTGTNPAPQKYLVYRNGIKIAETTSTQFTDTTAEIERGYNYEVSGYVDGIESDRATTSIYFTKTPLDFGNNDPSFSAADLLKGAAGYLLLFGGFILLVLSIIFAPQLQWFLIWIMGRMRKQEAPQDEMTYTIRVKNPRKVQKQLSDLYKSSNYAPVLKRGRRGGT